LTCRFKTHLYFTVEYISYPKAPLPSSVSYANFLFIPIAIVKRYNPGEFPAHCCKMRELEFTTRYLVHELEKCFDSPAFTNAVTQLGHLVYAWSAPNSGMYALVDWVRRLDTCLERLIRSFADIAEACRRRQADVNPPRLPQGMAERQGRLSVRQGAVSLLP